MSALFISPLTANAYPITSDLPSIRLLSFLTYSSAVAATLPFSRLNWRLEREAAEVTGAPTFRLSLSWASETFAQTSCCERDPFAASFSSLDTIRSLEDENWPASSFPRFCQRPDSTQNASIFIRPERARIMMLIARTRSCFPPLTMSPDWINTSKCFDTFSTASSFTSEVSYTRRICRCIASCSVRMFVFDVSSFPWIRKMVKFLCE
jgi:hypothetical protein